MMAESPLAGQRRWGDVALVGVDDDAFHELGEALGHVCGDKEVVRGVEEVSAVDLLQCAQLVDDVT